MTHTCCPACRLRIPRAAASGLGGCPVCGEPLVVASAAEALGLPLLAPAHPWAADDGGIAVAIAVARDGRPS